MYDKKKKLKILHFVCITKLTKCTILFQLLRIVILLKNVTDRILIYVWHLGNKQQKQDQLMLQKSQQEINKFGT